MRAVVVATGTKSALADLGPAALTPLLPLGDRPILQHILERLVIAGYRGFDFILADEAGRVERLFGDGLRWGCSISYHLTSDQARAAAMVAALRGAGEPFLLVQGDVLPLTELAFGGDRAVILRCASRQQDCAVHGDWSGWAWITPQLAGLFRPETTWAGLYEVLDAARLRGEARDCTPEHTLSCRTPGAYLSAQRLALGPLSHALEFGAFPSDAGIWIGRGVRLPASVEIIPPVLIGDYCRMGDHLVLGPNAVICAGCVIDDDSRIAESVVLPGSYVGRHLEVRNAIVHQSSLLNVRLEATLNVQDAFVLGVVQSERPKHRAYWTMPHTIARSGSVLLTPLALLLALARLLAGVRPVFHRTPFLARPREADGKPATLLSFLPAQKARTADRWRHFWLVFLPGLLNVAGGSVRLVGLPPRDRAEYAELPVDWRELAQEGYPGLLSESFVLHGPGAEEAVRFASEAYCAVHADWRITWRVLAKYWMLLCLGRPRQQSFGDNLESLDSTNRPRRIE